MTKTSIQRLESIFDCARTRVKTASTWCLTLVSLVLTALPAQAALDISATAVSTPARPGDYLGIEFTVTNTDAFARNGVGVEMVFPAGLAQLFEGSFGFDCPSTACEVGETVTWTVGSVPAGGATTLYFAPRVAPATADGALISFEPAVTDDMLDSASTTLAVDVSTDNLYEVALAESRDPATSGSLLTYKLTFGYLNDAAAVTNSTLRFTVPANATFVSATGGGFEAGGVVSWPLGFLSPGEGGTREVTVQLDGGLSSGELVTGSAEIFSVAAPAENAVASSNTAIAASSGLQLAVEANPNPARPGEFINVDVTVSNTDPFTRFDVTMIAPWSQELAQYFEGNFDGNCPSTACEAGEPVTFSLGDIPAGGAVTTSIPPRIANAALPGSIMTLPFTASDIAGLQTRQSDSVRVQSTNLFDVAIAEDADPATAGSALTYELHYALRADAGTVSNAILRLPLPEGVSFVSASDGGSVTGGAVVWPLGVLSPGQGGRRDVTVQIDAGLAASTVIEAVAEMTTASASVNSALAEANAVIASTSGLQISIQSNVNPARTGELMNLQLAVRNSDFFPRFDVSLSGIFPEGFAQLFEDGSGYNCASTACESGERVTWTLGEIAAGETVVVELPATIAGGSPDGDLINLYTQARDSLGLQALKMQTVRTEVDTVYDLTLAEDADPVSSGSTLNYKLAWGYRADAGAVNQSILSMPVPEGTSFVSATGGGTLVNGAVQWALGFLSPGDNGLREAIFSVDAGLPGGTVIEAAADLAGTSSTVNRLRAEAHTSVESSTGLRLAIETNADPARLNEKTQYRVTVSNLDPFTRFGVVLTGRFPQDIRQLFESQFDGNCPSTACESGEVVTWLLGNIDSGDARTVDLPGSLTTNGTDGILANFFAVAQDDQGLQTHQVDSIRLQSNTVYDLSLLESSDPAVPGSVLDYTLTWGHRDDAASVRNSRLQLILPPGVTLDAASDGGVHNGNLVTWDLGFLSPGDTGIRSATVTIDGALAPGNVLEAAADLFDITATDEGARSEANTHVRASVPLSLDVDAVVFTAVSGRSLNTNLTVSNNDAFTRFGVALKARFPEGVAQLFESVSGFDGDCPSTACESNEVVSWPLVDIPAGGSVTVNFPGVVGNGAVEGSLINLYAWVEDDQGVQGRGSASYPTGCIETLDADCDGVLDSVDNCLGVINTDQRDTDGDNIGNRCDADLNQDCQVNPIDLGLFKLVFFSSDNNADFDGNGTVNAVDLGILRTLFFQTPGPSALPNVCNP